jgi:hypothetical protein
MGHGDWGCAWRAPPAPRGAAPRSGPVDAIPTGYDGILGMAGYGGIWRDVAGYGGIWRDMAGYGGIWSDIIRYSHTHKNKKTLAWIVASASVPPPFACRPVAASLGSSVPAPACAALAMPIRAAATRLGFGSLVAALVMLVAACHAVAARIIASSCASLVTASQMDSCAIAAVARPTASALVAPPAACRVVAVEPHSRRQLGCAFSQVPCHCSLFQLVASSSVAR